MAKISIIIPIYNVQDYVAICLDSILAQTISDFEVLCIDDGSTDLSGDICEQYARKDSRIKVFHIANQGVSNARNFGLSKMLGEWFAFIDSDDWIEPDYMQTLYDNAIKNNCSVSTCNFQRNNEYMTGYNKNDIRVMVLNSSEECIHNFICNIDSMQGMSTSKLYNAELYGHIKFDKNVNVNEDCLYVYEIMKLCEKACYSTAKLYHWYIRQNSASFAKKKEKDFGSANVFVDLYNKTLGMNDNEVSDVLKYDYICAAVKILMYAKYKNTDEDVIEAKNRCKSWKKDAYKLFNAKEKVKYNIAFYMPWLSRLFNL